jgi:hypothetical protein
MRHIPVRITAGESGEVEAEIPAEAIGTGAHTLALVVLSERNGDLVHGQVVTAIRGEARFGSRVVDVEGTTASEPGASEVLSNGKHIPLNAPISTIEEGVLPLTIRMSLSSGECGGTVPLVASVFVNFEQVVLKNFDRPYVRVAADRDQGAVVETAAIVPPSDSSRHVLSVVVYEGDGLFTEAPPGNFTPWSSIWPYAVAFGYY